MESDASKRNRANSIAAAKDHPTSPNNNDGSISKSSRSPGTLEIRQVESEEYDIGAQGGESLASPSPRNQSHYEPIPTGKNSRRSPQNYAPSQVAKHSRPNSTNCTVNSAERSTGISTKPISIEPPVTKATLSELDVTKIVNNPKLRHDINFDPELHFRPNLDGEKGRRKTEKANNFWETMRGQLRDYLTDRERFERELGDSEWCLPATLNAIRGILETLVPQRDKASVEETFNVELLMQQFRKGVADLEKLALWLSKLLKCHCAPMRDNWVDDMVTQLSSGNRNSDVTLLVAGMKNLLGVLEAMKLDVANHQIRCLRPLLIDDTVQFEQKFFLKKIALQRIDIAGAHAWFRRASSSGRQSQTLDFINALVQLTLPSKSEMIPHTFLFDEERLLKLQSDMQDMINLEICMQLYRKLESQSRRLAASDDTPSAFTSMVSLPYHRPASPADEMNLSLSTLPPPHHFESSRVSHQDRGHLFRQAVGRPICVPKVNGSQSCSTTSSPRSSPSSTASTPDTLPPTPLYLSPEFSDSASQLQIALNAILSSSTSSNKWAAVSADLALEILRSTTTPLRHLPSFETNLASSISNPRSKEYQEAEQRVLRELGSNLEKLVEAYTPMTSLQIFEAATGPKSASARSTAQNGFKEEMTEMATRIAHIGILHWRVWAPLAYLVDPDAEEEITTYSERAKSMP